MTEARGLVLIDISVVAAPWYADDALRGLLQHAAEVRQESGLEVGVHWARRNGREPRPFKPGPDDTIALRGWRGALHHLRVEPRKRAPGMPTVLLSYVDDGPWSLRVPLAVDLELTQLVDAGAGMLVERLEGTAA